MSSPGRSSALSADPPVYLGVMPSELDDLCAEHGVVVEDSTQGAVVLRWGERRLLAPYRGPATPANVLCAVILDVITTDDMTEEEAVENDVGYLSAEESRRIFLMCRAEAEPLRTFLGEHYDEFAGAQH